MNIIDPSALVDQLVEAMENCPPRERLELVWQAFEQDNICSIGRPPSDDERMKVQKWYREKMFIANTFPYGYVRRIKPPVTASITAKASFLKQARCYTCEISSDLNGNSICCIEFPIQVGPWSAQSSRSNTEIKITVKNELKARNWVSPVPDMPFCIGIVALVPRSSRRKDCDNLSKGILDAMQGIVYVNDSQIQCLTVRRVEYSGNVGIYLIRADAVEEWGCDVIYDSNKPPTVLSGQPIAF
jgi:Holliday junction resolvase RusA-like endonuclease